MNAENTTGIFAEIRVVLGNMMKQRFECLMYLHNIFNLSNVTVGGGSSVTQCDYKQ